MGCRVPDCLLVGELVKSGLDHPDSGKTTFGGNHPLMQLALFLPTDGQDRDDDDEATAQGYRKPRRRLKPCYVPISMARQCRLVNLSFSTYPAPASAFRSWTGPGSGRLIVPPGFSLRSHRHRPKKSHKPSLRPGSANELYILCPSNAHYLSRQTYFLCRVLATLHPPDPA